MSKTEILSIAGSWEEVVDDCRASVSKPPLGHEPSTAFKLGILIAEHTPIRLIRIRWRWRAFASKGCATISSARPPRTLSRCWRRPILRAGTASSAK